MAAAATAAGSASAVSRPCPTARRCRGGPRRPRATRAGTAFASAVSSGRSPSDAVSLPLIDGPCVWRGPELRAAPELWTHRLTASEIAELDAALARARAANLDVIDLTPETFPLPSLAPRLRALRDELVLGRGVYLFRGLPVRRWDRWETCAAFYALGAHMGWTCPQNARGHVLGHVKDLGNDPTDPATRLYTTAAAQPFHTDSADIVGLLCVENAREGGESQVVSTAAVYNALASERPELAAALLEPFPVDRKGETPPGKKPTYAMPVFHLHPSSANDSSKRDDESLSSQKKSYALSGIYDRSFVDAAQSRWTEADGVPRLTQVQKDALDALDATCADDAFRLDMRLEPGDAQWLHNHTTFHARSAYERGSDRHLLRVWVAPENCRKLPEAFAERFGDLEPGPNRGGVRVEGQTPYCALEPGG